VTAKILITGYRGQLGRALDEACRGRGIAVDGRDLDTLDICDGDAVRRWITTARPTAVVNCAAMTAVDRCESEIDAAMKINGAAVGHLASACDSVGATLVQLSTDYVFRGDGDRAFTEDDPTEPVSVYGRSKLLGETSARTAVNHLVVRTAWLFGFGGVNFVEAIRGQIEAGKDVLRVVDDQRGCPTFGNDLATAILDLMDAGAQGVVHAVNSGTVTWHGFAAEIVRQLGAEVAVEAISTEQTARPARRPSNSVLATDRLQGILGRALPPWQDGLARYLALS
jgi:dTDP-4-dehydrorhamnose reductase